MAMESLEQSAIAFETRKPDSKLKFLTSSPIIAVAVISLALVIAAAIFAPLLAPHDPQQLAPALRLKPPSETFPLGTDAYGRDLLSRVLYGGRISLVICICGAVISIA